jgi:2-phosphoglycerate kinase
MKQKVLLLAGAPLSGKTSLARWLARYLGWDLVHGDDISAAVRAIVPADLRTSFDPMMGLDWRNYYLDRTFGELVDDANATHREIWPAIKSIIVARSTWADPAIIEWWGFRPSLVRETMSLEAVCSLWLHVDPGVFVPRLTAQSGFYSGCRDPVALINAFCNRSRHFNESLHRECGDYGLPVLSAAPNEDVPVLGFRALTLIREVPQR